jgi:hypothetical protein
LGVVVKVARTIMIILQAHTGVLCVLLLIYIYTAVKRDLLRAVDFCVVELNSEQVKLNFSRNIYQF